MKQSCGVHPWLFNAVDKEKPEPHMISASVDLGVPNQLMDRNRIIQVMIVEDFMCKCHDCTLFFKLDMRKGYHQLLLTLESRKIAIFRTPWGTM